MSTRGSSKALTLRPCVYEIEVLASDVEMKAFSNPAFS